MRARFSPLPVLLSAALVAATAGCAASEAATSAQECSPVSTDALVPDDGVLVGANVDWGSQTLAEYGTALGHRPAVAVSFSGLPMSAADGSNVAGAVEQVRADGGVLLLTLEPTGGLATVTDAVAADLAGRLEEWNRSGVPVVVRFAHEMNGSWYAWGQQPAAYVAAFRRVAAAVHAGAPGSAMMWAPNYGGGHPFAGGPYQAVAGSPDAAVLDTDGDGAVTALDDPYAPYWPGTDVVDWVGMSLYHWGDVAPWGENEVPEPGKLVAQLTGEYVGLGGDDRALPDFHGVYGVGYDKPLAVPETAALYVPGAGGADEAAVKQSWWRQVFDPGLHQALPRLAMVNWFEWDKQESEVDAEVDWRVTADPALRSAYAADLPAWARWAEALPPCAP
ncbi:glycosyl hydrolase [Modestobacter altitudinis]|uniref:glycosyl hydrolase n=1 Tax=Modestobacter altitudinis TaxID=2213158 RepID=UPI00148736E6|nr:glycosyl hydrolase [Modestobacter altitudinis]